MELKFEIRETLNKYIEGNKSQTSREKSFDYCYNYFRQHDSNFIIENMELSCLNLGFYLASWGMLRGSSFLLQKSVKYYEKTILFIAESKTDENLWSIDLENYLPENINKIINTYHKIKECLIEEKQTSITLITKVLLGVYGFMPAFDTYFIAGFKSIYKNGFSVINEKSLNLISDFYLSHQADINNISKQLHTIDFQSGNETLINYPKAKIVDMYGFEIGIKVLENKKNE